MASAISRRPWPTFTTARPAKPSISFLPCSVHTHTPSARSMTSSSSESHGWSCVLCVQRWRIASAGVVMAGTVSNRRGTLRDGHPERRAVAFDALDLDASVVRFDDALDDREPEAGALDAARRRAPHAIELVEDVRQVRGGNAEARVAHGDEHAVRRAPDRDGHAAARRRVLHRV